MLVSRVLHSIVHLLTVYPLRSCLILRIYDVLSRIGLIAGIEGNHQTLKREGNEAI